MIDRLAFHRLNDLLTRWPACALVGPRQCGKTTLARSLGGEIFDLELESERLRLDLAWDGLIRGDRLIVLDEAQSWPGLFPRLRAAIDQRRDQRGRFLLLGSVSPLLMTQVAESLAGRLAVLPLSPFLRGELPPEARERHWLCGGFPDGGCLDPGHFPEWQEHYLDLLAQRDLPELGLGTRPQQTARLLRMLAAVHGQEWNASRLGQSLGLSYHTVNHHVDVLEGAFLARRLPAWHRNAGKRLVKRPKLYLRDSGLLHSLLRIRDGETLLEHPAVGASWESHVIDQALGLLECLGIPHQVTYLRSSDQYEIDLILEGAGAPVAVEIKLSSQADPRDVARLSLAADWIGAGTRVVVTAGGQDLRSASTWICGLDEFLAGLPELLG
ncbi:MAG: ATP-binding protein [bacterium]|nr:ATP-binding protein [bacterium]